MRSGGGVLSVLSLLDPCRWLQAFAEHLQRSGPARNGAGTDRPIRQPAQYALFS